MTTVMPPPDYTGSLKLLYYWQALAAGGFAIIAAVIGALAAYFVGRAQIRAAQQKDHLQGRGIALGVYPELLELRALHRRASQVVEQWSLRNNHLIPRMPLALVIKDTQIPMTPPMARNIDNFFLIESGAQSLQKIMSLTLQYNGLVEKIANQIAFDPNVFDPLAHQKALSGHLEEIQNALEEAIQATQPIYLSTTKYRFSTSRL